MGARILSESEFNDVVMALPSIKQRGDLWGHVIALDLAMKEAKNASVPESVYEDARKAEREKIVAWLMAENSGDTVRATYGRKLAGRIENGEYE